MDNFRGALIAFFFVYSTPSFAVNSWVPKWVDGPATATYERTPTTLKTYVNVPSAGGHAEYTLNSNPTQSWGSGKAWFYEPSPGVSTSRPTGSFGPSSTSSTPKISTNVKLPLGSGVGASVSATLTAAIPKQALAKAAVALVRANPYVTTAITIGWLANAGYQYFKDTDTFIYQPPAPLTTGYVFAGKVYATVQEACSAADFDQYTYIQAGTSNYCNEYVNGVPDYYGHPVGYTTSGVGGPVPEPQVKTPEQAVTDISKKPISGTSDSATGFDDELSELVQNGYYPDLDTSTTPLLTGPATPVQGEKSTEVSPDGSVKTVNTVYNNTFTNNYLETSQVTTTTVTPASGTPVTTVTTTSPNTTAPSKDQLTDCDKFPLSIGCSQYGSLPTAEILPVTSVPVTMSYSSWGSGSCPNPVSGPHGIVFDYQPMCDKLILIKPIMVGTALLLALFIVSAAVKD